jgi:hypothetical protein
LYKVFNNTPYYEYIKSASKGKDGRKDYQALKDHYLGANNTNLLAAKYEKDFDKATHILKDFLSTYSSARSSKITQIGAVGGNQSGGGRRSNNNNNTQGGKDGRGDGNANRGNSSGVEDRYNSPTEYKK